MSRVVVTQFTDPFSIWCWGAEPVRRRLAEVYREQVRFEYVMGGLAEDYDDFRDPAGDADRREEVAHHWQAAAHRHEMPVDVSLWREDPPSSSYPANVAYLAARSQGRELAHGYLRRMREAVATEARNIEHEEVLVDLAAEVGLDAERLRADLDSGWARQAFGANLQRTREHGVTAFPTFLVDAAADRELLRGYRPLATFEKLFARLDLDLRAHDPRPVHTFVQHYGRVATREVAEVRELSTEEAEAELRELEAAGDVRAVEAGRGYLWEPA